ncbi:MAG: type I 3-dehydroquinate dehydratase [Acidobacteria bacterium]|nr:type I 3-dehydroquinate dehydratase [Acidobacteriota bacterium]
MDLCLTLAEQSLISLQEKLARYASQLAYVEVRLDCLGHLEVPELPKRARARFIATCRPRREGGYYDGPETERIECLAQAARRGFQWVDLEHDVASIPVLPRLTCILRSLHCFGAFPEELEQLMGRLRALPGDLAKLVVTVNDSRELVKLLRFQETIPAQPPRVIHGMGSFGQPSRFLGAFTGNFWTYVSENSDHVLAAGQFPFSEAAWLYRLPEWRKPPIVYGVLGNPIAHSLSPWLHNCLFQRYEMGKVYFPFQLSEVHSWFDFLPTTCLRFGGFSITSPFKTDVLQYTNHIESPIASINTLVKVDSGWEGLNSDYAGFLKPLLSRLELGGKTVLVLGYGGVARTVVTALKNEGADVTITGRNRSRAAQFASELGCSFLDLGEIKAADILINATPVGQFPSIGESLLEEQQLQFDLVYDLVYHPERTLLIRLAEKKGIPVISGLEMFVEQAALQFMAWTGFNPDRDLMKKWVREALRTVKKPPQGDAFASEQPDG